MFMLFDLIVSRHHVIYIPLHTWQIYDEVKFLVEPFFGNKQFFWK